MAEWLSTQPLPSHGQHPPSLLELGCGAAPAAGLASLALGYNVIFTDLPVVLPSTRRNLELNATGILARRATSAPWLKDLKSLSRQDADILELAWGSGQLPPRVCDLLPFSFIICSDCIFRSSLHQLLASTLHKLLTLTAEKTSFVTSETRTETTTMIAFQKRSDEDLLFFDHLALVGLSAARVDIASLLSTLKWPVKHSDAVSEQDLSENIFLYRITMAKSSLVSTMPPP